MSFPGFAIGVQESQNRQARDQALQDEERQNKLALLSQAWGQTTDPTQRQAIQTAMQSLYPTPQHAGDFLRDIFHLKKKQDSATPPAATPPTQTAAPPQTTWQDAMPGMSQSPPPISQVAQVAKAPTTQEAWQMITQIPSVTQAQQEAPERAYQQYLKLNPEATPEEKKQALNAIFKFPTPSKTTKLYESPDKKERNWFVPGSEPEGWNAATTGTSGYIRQGNHVVTPDSAISLMDTVGATYPKQDGTTWTPEELKQFPKGTVLSAFILGDKTFYAPFDQRTRTATWGNVVHQIPEAGQITDQSTDELGEARVPTKRTSVTPGPAGAVVTSSTTTPVSSGSKAPVSSATPQVPEIPPSTPKAMPKKPLSKQPGAKAMKTIERQDQENEIPPMRNPALPPMKGADEQRITSVAAPMATVEQQVVGRGAKPLWEFSSVLNNPDLMKAVNLAMAAPMLQTPEGDKGITFWGTVATSLGLASAAQQATTEAIVEARNKVQQDGGPEAVQFLDRLAELKGTIPNLRKVQGGSSALGAIAPLYQESPIMNISSPEDFRNRTANMLRTMAVALNEAPGINKKHVDWLYKQADKAEGADKSKPKYQVGQTVKLKSGKSITIKHVYPDGSFD